MAKKIPNFKFYSICDRMGNAAVMIEWGALNGTLEPAQARAVATGLQVASIDAESDAALLLFLQDGGSEPRVAEEIVENVRRKRTATRMARAAEAGETAGED